MKKTLLILCACLFVAAILCFPMKTQFKEGGTTFYSALAYRVIVWHAIGPSTGESDPHILTGTDVYLFPRNFHEYEYYFERRFGAKLDENTATAPTTAEAPTATPDEPPAPTGLALNKDLLADLGMTYGELTQKYGLCIGQDGDAIQFEKGPGSYRFAFPGADRANSQRGLLEDAWH